LAKSLGGRATITSRIPKCDGKEGQRAYRVFISFPPIAQSNSIESIEDIGLKECRCITIDKEDGFESKSHTLVLDLDETLLHVSSH